MMRRMNTSWRSYIRYVLCLKNLLLNKFSFLIFRESICFINSLQNWMNADKNIWGNRIRILNRYLFFRHFVELKKEQ